MGFKRFLQKARPGNYLRELSVVILGIFITLTATNYFSGRSKKSEYRQIIQMVHAELIENKKSIDSSISEIVLQREMENYFFEYRDRIDSIPYDTLMAYHHIHQGLDYPEFIYHSLEVLKYSSSIYTNKDVKAIRDIMEAYDYVAMSGKCINMYYEEKGIFINRLIEETGIKFNSIPEKLSAHYSSSAMYNYIIVIFPEQVIEICREYSNNIGRIINEIEKKYRIKDVYKFDSYEEHGLTE